MDKKNMLYPVLIFFVILALSGCSTAPKKYHEEMTGMKTRVETLESRVDTVETKQAEAEKTMADRGEAPKESKYDGETSNIEIKPRFTKTKEHTKDTQLALKNAGYYKGSIDGVKGKATRKAVRAFQKANGLTPDGIVGKKTWDLLSKHLEGSSAAGETVK